MSGLTDRWHRKSKPGKVESYTRWTFHSFALIEVSLVWIMDPLGGWLLLLACLHAGMSTLLQARALDWRLGRRERPVRLGLATAALTAMCAAVVIALASSGVLSNDDSAAVVLVAFASYGLGAMSLVLRTTRHMAYAVLGTTATTGVLTVAMRLPGPQAFGMVLAVACASAGIVFTYVLSAWLLSTVRELDAARELQARLAVAEERLRFGRDLHDVMGRNLAVIALKSELAVQLAERGRPEAVAQMTEVQRIARESQREVRDVVRGYREADLHTELEGARGVLEAAGIDCRIEGGDGGGLSAGVQSALAWVVREATTNVLRHGDARRCTVRLTEAVGSGSEYGPEYGSGSGPRYGSGSGYGEEREVVLVVENDGAGEAAAVAVPVDAAGDAAPGAGGPVVGRQREVRKGSGLDGLRERLAVVNGTLDAGRVDGDLFRLTARVPLPAGGPDSGRGAGPEAGAGDESAVGTGVVVGRGEVAA
ncbi:sensor histidine kinase [Streptomyces liangshanensis]|uniref:Sensor histidine kinase n=1 Tax=Streptomyces liangshanensis TaxID=2717324 RepID=A0A6G9H0A9_9ACTN|nr:histidine kinase [Streptomyces liangshanensis]QIQ03973.1 sensor histidine kinase [Streptomyces liangshanensis]